MTHDLKNFFNTKMWAGGGEQTKSGQGSTVGWTEPLRRDLEKLFRRLDVKVLLDAPCGDFNWMRHVRLNGIQYHGLDIIDEIIEQNIVKYSRPNRTFRVADLTRDPLPEADLMLCRDCTFHLPLENVWQILENFAGSDIKYLLLTTHTGGQNRDMAVPGGFSSRDFLAPPFRFPHPGMENWIPDHPAPIPARYLGLWSAEQIRAALKKAGRAPRQPSE